MAIEKWRGIHVNSKQLLCCSAAFTVLVLAGCATRQPLDTSVSGPDPKLTLTAYKAEGKLVALVAGTRVAQVRGNSDYIPLEVAIVNKGLKGLALTPESFELIDENGTRYPVVAHAELARNYGDIDTDRRLAELPGVIAGLYGSYTRVDSVLTTSFDKPLAQDLFIPRFSYAVDFLYFAAPAAGVRGHRFELFMTSPDLEDPVFVKFAVKGKKNGNS
jgi:hypothetical protein